MRRVLFQRRWSCAVLCVALALCLWAASADAAPIFQDDFEAEALGLNQLLDNWNISGGTIDVVGTGFFQTLCSSGSPSPARCIDLDGSRRAAGQITTKTALSFAPGSYTLSFYMSGSRRGETNTVNFGIGGLLTDSLTLPSASPWTPYSYSFTVALATNAFLFFDNLGGDNRGALLDNVSVDLVSADIAPEPTSIVLIGSGLVGLVFRRKSASRLTR
jgi:PEP-CTERM motif